MKVGVPKEIKVEEYRVGLTPESVREYVAHGHTVTVEATAGEGIGASDEAYVHAGAVVVDSAEEVYASADLIVKVKEPQHAEWLRLREGQILFAYLHLAADPAQAQGLINSGVTAIAYETVTDGAQGLPLLAPMSEVAGRLSIEAGAAALRRHTGGRGILLGGIPSVRPARVVVLGGGVVGTHAARMALGLGAEVTVIDRSLVRLRAIEEMFAGRARTRFSTAQALEEEIAEGDVIIGAVLAVGASTPKLISRDMLALLKPATVLVDVAIDQGGCFETSHPTTHADPTYEVDGIIHYCVANMPGVVPVTASQALNNATLPFGLELADKGVRAITDDVHLASGLNVMGGEVMHPAVAQSLGIALSAHNSIRPQPQ